MTKHERELTEADIDPDTTEPDIPETDPPDPPAETDDYEKPPDYELEGDRADFPDSAYDDADDDEDEPVDDEPDLHDPEDETEHDRDE